MLPTSVGLYGCRSLCPPSKSRTVTQKSATKRSRCVEPPPSAACRRAQAEPDSSRWRERLKEIHKASHEKKPDETAGPNVKSRSRYCRPARPYTLIAYIGGKTNQFCRTPPARAKRPFSSLKDSAKQPFLSPLLAAAPPPPFAYFFLFRLIPLLLLLLPSPPLLLLFLFLLFLVR